jgi:hypothetical protein
MVLLYFTIWLFNWDDEIDEPTGSYSDDLEAAERYRKRTTDFLLECLGLRESYPAVRLDLANNKIIASFSDIGEPLRRAYTLGKCWSFLTRRYFMRLQRVTNFGKPNVNDS